MQKALSYQNKHYKDAKANQTTWLKFTTKPVIEVLAKLPT
jgi:hypothetical protein